MNKITSTLTGLALVAAASVAPAFAQGNLFTPVGTTPTYTIIGVGTSSFSVSGTASYNLTGSSAITPNVPFTITGSDLNGPLYQISSLKLNGVTDTFGPGSFFVVATLPSGGTSISSVGPLPDGNTFNLVSSPVPEASTVVSFGALLALGGLAVVLRRKGVKNAA